MRKVSLLGFTTALIWLASHHVILGQTLCDGMMDLCGQVDTLFQPTATMDLENSLELPEEFQNKKVQAVRFHTTFLSNNGEGTAAVFNTSACGATFWSQVFQPDPLSPCDASAYIPASPLLIASGDTTLTTDPLFINTDYILLVATESDGCELGLRLQGKSVSINVCCTTNIDFGESATVEVTGADWQLGFVWDPEIFVEMIGNQEARLTPPETRTFEVHGFVEGCEYVDYITISVGPPIPDPPNAFSPNDDGYNDTWNIAGLSQFRTSTIEVFDRWGQSVYRSVSYPNPWNGKNHGQDVPAGTYYFIIHLNEPNANFAPITGHVAIVR